MEVRYGPIILSLVYKNTNSVKIKQCLYSIHWFHQLLISPLHTRTPLLLLRIMLSKTKQIYILKSETKNPKMMKLSVARGEILFKKSIRTSLKKIKCRNILKIKTNLHSYLQQISGQHESETVLS